MCKVFIGWQYYTRWYSIWLKNFIDWLTKWIIGKYQALSREVTCNFRLYLQIGRTTVKPSINYWICNRYRTSFSSKVSCYNRKKPLWCGRTTNCPRRSRRYICCSSALKRLLTVVRGHFKREKTKYRYLTYTTVTGNSVDRKSRLNNSMIKHVNYKH